MNAEQPEMQSRAARWKVKRVLVTFLVAAGALLLFAPAGGRGQCPAGGECIMTTISLVGLPGSWFVAIPAVTAAGVLAWTSYTRRRDERGY